VSRIESILIRPKKGEAVQILESCDLVAGCGISGDHHYQTNCLNKDQVTLIESEALVAAERDYSISLSHEESGRNLLTSGVYLNHLVGKVFQIGEAKLLGIELCEPCGTLERSTKKGVIKALIHRGGLRAEIIKSGLIQTGDTVNIGPTA